MTISARMRALGVSTAILLGATAFLAPVAATAEEPAPAPIEGMIEYSPSDFVTEALELPADLVDALARDVGLTPEEYLAEGAAATQAVAVVDSLEEAGIGVLGSRLEGTDLVVNVATDADASAVVSAGAVAEFGEPAPAWDPTGMELEFADDTYSGQGILIPVGSQLFQCSIGFNGFLVANGARQFATAGHCTDGMSGNARIFEQSAPGQAGSPGDTIGAEVAGTEFFGSGYDVSRIASTGSGINPKPSVLTWNGGTGAPLAGTPVGVTGTVAPIIGATLCKSGSRTGWACGPIVDRDDPANVGGVIVNSVVAKLCVLPGDSGGAAIQGTKAVGITSWTTTPSGCQGTYSPPGVTPVTGSYAGFFQMRSPGGLQSVASEYGGEWEVGAVVSRPTITSFSGSDTNQTAINGTVPNYGVDYKVDVFIDGSSTVFATANVSASNGSWSVNVSSLPAGIHTFSAVARHGTWSKSAAATGYVKRGMSVDRIAGADRFATSAAVAGRFDGDPTRVYIASGLNYPDALSAAPIAAINGSPLLLTLPTSLPSSIASALTGIQPSQVVILGGTPSVSNGVRNQIAALLPGATITRIAGADRYETSRLVSKSGFPGGAIASYIATGNNFPDALSAGAAAASVPGPVVLVNGASSTLDTATRNLLVSLGIDDAYITGSTPSVSAGIQSGIDAISGVSVERLAGPDRYVTSVAINEHAFSSASDAYLAVGTGFADALSGAALAGATDAPLFVVPGNCVPAQTLGALAEMGVTKVHLLGSSASLNGDVAALKSC
ncbi:MAG: cell wall-binding repeat-containing protein [Rhodoglobus sp.]|nr:cell wall-binding repeat-containing protein [Rhodoglobus sp.]